MQKFCGLLRARGFAGAYQDVLTGLRQAIRKPGAFRSRSA